MSGLSDTDVMNDYKNRMLDLVAENGHAVQGVFPNDPSEGLPFAYTVGLTLAGWPELVMVGMDLRLMTQLLNQTVRVMQGAGATPTDGLVIDHVLEGYPVRLRAVSDDSDIAVDVTMARTLFPHKDVTVLQVLWPDVNGRFPDEPGFAQRTTRGDLVDPAELLF